MRHLVTGGAGFIGSHLIDQIMKDEDAEVICVDNFQTGAKANVASWLGNTRFELVRHDVSEPLRVDVDKVWHLACPASPREYQRNAIATSKTNVLGTLNMLGIAKRCRARILLASTSEIYGDPLVHPQSEDYLGNVNSTGIRSCYDEGKRMAESLCFDYARTHGVEIRVARIFNTYGPRMSPRDGRVVTNLITQALTGKSLTLYGNGLQTRSFCYVDDLVRGLMALMNSEIEGPVNLGNPKEITINELALIVKVMVNPKAEFEYRPLPKDDPQRRKPDITKANKTLSWQPVEELETGLIKTIESVKNQMPLGISN
jgi:UDP-glucuronate decarboxylase